MFVHLLVVDVDDEVLYDVLDSLPDVLEGEAEVDGEILLDQTIIKLIAF